MCRRRALCAPQTAAPACIAAGHIGDRAVVTSTKATPSLGSCRSRRQAYQHMSALGWQAGMGGDRCWHSYPLLCHVQGASL